MFIQNLTPVQQSALLYLATELIKVDGDFHEQEEYMLNQLKQQCDEGVSAKAVDIAQLNEIFTEQEAKVSMLLELIAIAHADEVLHHSEVKLLKEIVTVLDIDYLYEDCQQWLKDMLAHMDKASALMTKPKPTPFEEMIADVKTMNYEDFCNKYAELDVGDRNLSELERGMLSIGGFSRLPLTTTKSAKERLLERSISFRLISSRLK